MEYIKYRAINQVAFYYDIIITINIIISKLIIFYPFIRPNINSACLP